MKLLALFLIVKWLIWHVIFAFTVNNKTNSSVCFSVIRQALPTCKIESAIDIEFWHSSFKRLTTWCKPDYNHIGYFLAYHHMQCICNVICFNANASQDQHVQRARDTHTNTYSTWWKVKLFCFYRPILTSFLFSLFLLYVNIRFFFYRRCFLYAIIH